MGTTVKERHPIRWSPGDYHLSYGVTVWLNGAQLKALKYGFSFTGNTDGERAYYAIVSFLTGEIGSRLLPADVMTRLGRESMAEKERWVARRRKRKAKAKARRK